MRDADIPTLVDRIYEGALDPLVWPDILTGIAGAVGGVGGLVMPVSSDGDGRVICSPSLLEAGVAYENYWWRHDRRVQFGQEHGLRDIVVTDLDMFSEAEIGRDPFYQDFLRPHGLGPFAGHVTSPIPGRVNALSIMGDVRKRTFAPSEKTLLERLGRHASRALGLATRLAQQNRIGDAMTSVVERLDCGIILLDDLGSVQYVNAAAERSLGPALAIRQRRLFCENRLAQRALDALIGSVLPGRSLSARNSVALRREDRRPLLVDALPMKAETSDVFQHVMLGAGGVILLLHDPDLVAKGSMAERFQQLGLTAGEARVAASVGQGCSSREAASALGIKETSVRQVLKSVYAKLGIARQSQLAAITAKLTIIG